MGSQTKAPLDFGKPTDLEWVTVKTTLPKQPFQPIGERSHIKTERLIVRPVQESDDVALNELRSQPEVMTWTSQGKPDVDIEATRKTMEGRLPPNDTTNFDWAICLAETGQLVGIGGSFKRSGELGWPVVGYMFRKEAWGKGYATEFVRNFLKAYWAMPREEVEHKVERSSVQGDGGLEAECIVAVTVTNNFGSQNVLKKCGFELVKVWEEEDLQGGNGLETLLGFTCKRPKSEAA